MTILITCETWKWTLWPPASDIGLFTPACLFPHFKVDNDKHILINFFHSCPDDKLNEVHINKFVVSFVVFVILFFASATVCCYRVNLERAGPDWWTYRSTKDSWMRSLILYGMWCPCCGLCWVLLIARHPHLVIAENCLVTQLCFFKTTNIARMDNEIIKGSFTTLET